MDKDYISENELNTEFSADHPDTVSEQYRTQPKALGFGDASMASSSATMAGENIQLGDTTDGSEGLTKDGTESQQDQADKKLDKQEKKKVESSAKTMKKLKNSEKSVKHYQFFIIRLIIILIVLWVLFFKVVGITKMPNGDMFPRIDQGDFILFYRLDKNFKAQDVVVIEKVTPDSNGKKQIFVCRVVAVAGDTVEVTDNQRLIVNGNTMIEGNIFYQTPRYEGYTEYPITLKEGEIFVLADMRNGGHDSRYFGPITKDDVIGTVITILRRNGI